MKKAARILTPEELKVKRKRLCENARRWREAHPPTPESLAKGAEIARRYRRENKEKVCAASKARRHKTGKRDAAQQKAWRESNVEQQREYWKKYRAAHRAEIKERDASNYFKKHSEKLAQKQEYYQKNKEEVSARNKNHTHRRRAQKYGSPAPATAAQIKSLLTSAVECCYCHLPFDLVRRKTIDHIMPLIRGGSHAIENLCVCCKSCNSSKGTKLVR